jgi:hypothetical protein
MYIQIKILMIFTGMQLLRLLRIMYEMNWKNKLIYFWLRINKLGLNKWTVTMNTRN